MTLSSNTPFSLSPEQHLMAELPQQWRSRFERAIEMMYISLEEGEVPVWQDIAERCSISPYHFHRMFRSVFFQAPGQYLRRMQLQVAVRRLFDEPDASITDIAHRSGFSSSQALAKVLRRELATSAGDIRELAAAGQLEPLEKLVMKLGHPLDSEERCLEQQIASSIPFTIEDHPPRHLYLQGPFLIDMQLVDPFKGIAPLDVDPLVVVQQISDVDDNQTKQRMSLGYFAEEGEANTVLPAGRYLTCHVEVDSEISYMALWDAVFKHLMYQGLEVDERGLAIESMTPPHFDGDVPIEVRLELPIK